MTMLHRLVPEYLHRRAFGLTALLLTRHPRRVLVTSPAPA